MRSEKQVRKLGRKLSVGPIGKLPKESINKEIDKSAMYQEIDKSNMCKKIYKNKAEQRRNDMLNPKVSINETVDKGL